MEKRISTVQYQSPVGELLIGEFDEKICICDWQYRKQRAAVNKRLYDYLGASFVKEATDLTQQAIHQLNEYFYHQRKEFNLPLLPIGTSFQKKVWKLLQSIPYGHTLTYGELSSKTGSPHRVRAVAAANGANALSIFIPCHRVIGANGELTGYAGGIQAKRKLLELEAGARQISMFD